MHLNTDGIVLRQFKAEGDRILTLLTRTHGVITAYANGANKPRSRLASSTELLCFSDFILFSSRDRYVVDKADSLQIFTGIRGDIERLSIACYLAQISAELAPHGENSDEYLRLLLNTLSFLDAGRRPNRQLRALFELRLLTLAGYMPDLVGCSICGRFETDHMLFFPQQGALICSECRSNGMQGGVILSKGVLAAMRHIIYCEQEKLFSFSLSNQGLDLLSRVSEDYLKCRLEKTFPALEFLAGLA